MSNGLPKVPDDAENYLNFIGLLGLIRVSIFEAFGDRRFWDERYFDLLMSMLAKQLRGSVSTLEDMTGAIRGVSHSTKIRMIEEARKAGLIEASNRSEITLTQPLDDISARKVFFLSQSAMDQILSRLTETMGDVRDFASQHQS
ncbi:MAG: hypothetical protein AAF557_14450 [Pseudomonadota bacterium]